MGHHASRLHGGPGPGPETTPRASRIPARASQTPPPPPPSASPLPPPPLPEEERKYKLLILGTGESGKSTLFKNILTLTPGGLSDQDLKCYQIPIINNIHSAFRTLVEQSAKLSARGGQFAACAITDAKVREIATALAEAKIDWSSSILLPEQIDVIRTVWSDPGIQLTYDYRCEYQLIEECRFYFENIQRYGSDERIPDMDEYMRCRVRTTGIVETTLAYKGISFRVFDVGGARNERKKWIHCYEDVDAVLFTSAVSEFNLTLFEDEKQNRLAESFLLFDNLCNSRWFEETEIIIFMNKIDSLRDKLARYSFHDYMPEYTGDNSFDSVVEWLQNQFRSLNRSGRSLHIFMTNCVSKDNFEQMFSNVRDIISRRPPRGRPPEE